MYDEIYEAYLAGEMDRQEQVLLFLRAMYLPHTLPDELEGETAVGSRRTPRREMQWLINHYQELDPATQDLVLPFILPPTDPRSYFHIVRDWGEETSGHMFPGHVVHATSQQWEEQDIVLDGAPPITLCYPLPGTAGARQDRMEARLNAIEEALRRAWPMFRDLLDVQPEHEVKIYLKDLGGTGYATYHPNPDDGSIDRYRVGLDLSDDLDFLKALTVHELFHCFQFAMGLTWEGDDLWWLSEATAVWSELHVYPHPEFPEMTWYRHGFLPEFFESLDHERLSLFGDREYGSYMLFFFVTDHWGSPDSVPEVLRAVLATRDVRGSLMQRIDDFADAYGQFAVCNWNFDPPRYCYSDAVQPMPPGGTSRQSFIVETPGKALLEDTLHPGGIVYRIFEIPVSAEDVERVTFDFGHSADQADALFQECICGASRQEEEQDATEDPGHDSPWFRRLALLRIGDTWLPEPEDWTDLEYKEFDRTQAYDEVTAVILIMSNSDMQESLHHEYQVVAEGRPWLVPLTHFGPAVGYDFPKSGHGVIAMLPAQERRSGVPGVEVQVPLSGTYTTVYPPAPEPMPSISPRCTWPIMDDVFRQDFAGAANWGLRDEGGGGSYKLNMSFRRPVDFSESELLGFARQEALQYFPEGFYQRLRRFAGDLMQEDAMHYQWSFDTGARAALRGSGAEVHAYGVVPEAEHMVLQIMRRPSEPDAELDIEVSWEYEGQGQYGVGGSRGLVTIEISYEVFEVCQGDPLTTGSLLSVSSTGSVADSDAERVALPEGAEYVQIAVFAAAESIARPPYEDPISAELDVEVVVRIVDRDQ